jgi:glucose-1-phosphate thymidylyltransferase
MIEAPNSWNMQGKKYMEQTLRIIIPMAGLGTRLRPHTWSRPKPLLTVAGKAVLGHVLDMFTSLPNQENIEIIFIVGYLGEQAEKYINDNYPNIKAHFVVQEEMRGQSHAIYLAQDYLTGPAIVVFVDTLIETDLSFLSDETVDAVTCVQPVPDPRRFGVAVLGSNEYVTRLVEKPDDMSNNLAIVGFYYFRDSSKLLAAIEEQIERNIQLKNEFFLADAVNIMLERGLKMKTQPVDIWLDAGTADTLLQTNRYLLDHGRDNSSDVEKRPGTVINPPVYIHPTAQIENSIVGPYVSIGADCQVRSSILQDTILEDGAQTSGAILERSLIGRKACVERRPTILNAGDQTEITL